MRSILKESTLADLKQAFDGAIEDIKASFEGAIQEAYEAGRESVVDRPKTVKRKAEVGEKILITNKDIGERRYKNGDIFEVDDSQFDRVYFKTTQNLPILCFHEEYEVIIEEPKTANEQRAELIQRVKKFLSERQAIRNGDEKFQDRESGNHVARNCWYETDFFIKDRKVTAVVYGLVLGNKRQNEPKVVGRAKCMPNEVFNEHIGKAIALARALDIDVPEEFLNAVQPDEVVLGMETSILCGFSKRPIGEICRVVNFNCEGYPEYDDGMISTSHEIFSDTNAEY